VLLYNFSLAFSLSLSSSLTRSRKNINLFYCDRVTNSNSRIMRVCDSPFVMPQNQITLIFEKAVLSRDSWCVIVVWSKERNFRGVSNSILTIHLLIINEITKYFAIVIFCCCNCLFMGEYFKTVYKHSISNAILVLCLLASIYR
jgi:hypothetical protein